MSFDPDEYEIRLVNGRTAYRYAVSESYTGEDYDRYKAVHSGKGSKFQLGFPCPPPPDYHGYIYLPGSCAGYWADRAEVWRKRIIHPEQYLEAVETALDYGWEPTWWDALYRGRVR